MTKLSIQTFSREYYKQRHQTVRKPVNQKTECCGQDIDHDVLNKSNPKDWEMMLNHCEDHLDQYPSTETIEPVCCKDCGRLQQYLCSVNNRAYYNMKD